MKKSMHEQVCNTYYYEIFLATGVLGTRGRQSTLVHSIRRSTAQ